ncbi:SRPBCC family protein [Blastopirellula sp. JC732]|uniref:SRPBCC family protein n=1 Tax=Blastopirellula sediminis TaxID=2894196 RepID=A0A9X1MR24_9BACT|nr:SRPBCC family protein [Blastopirellula sediminis]MCC9606654.1 SRPBCC family protein [Blastopirellula sediminis]MCC9630049.1 SRPBCC family protein [Blastopirellula sediminis]
MKLVVRSVLALMVLITIPFFVALFMPREITVTRQIVIERPRAEVFDFIKLLKNQEKFSIWGTLPGERQVSIQGEDGTEGAIIAWKSDDSNIGAGEQEITGIKQGERIDFLIRYTKPYAAIDSTYMQTDDIYDNQTQVTSTYITTMNYPTNLFLVFAEEMISDQVEISLERLKRILENPPGEE